MKFKDTPRIITSDTTLDKEFYNIPLFGEVHLDHNDDFFKSQRSYDLGEIITNSRKNARRNINVRAADDGLADAGIFKDDFLTVHIDAALKDGDIAVIRLGYKIYIRKIYFDKKRVRLESETGNPAPLIIDRETPGFEIVGKVVTVIREL